MIDLVVRNATVFDGSGSPPFVGDVAVRGGLVELVGDAGGLEAPRVIDAAGIDDLADRFEAALEDTEAWVRENGPA